jgi:hypothetical protein
MLSTWSTSKSEPVRRKVRGRKEEEMVEKPSVIANYVKNMGRVDTADQYCVTYCFFRRTLKWWRKLFFWGLEVSVINAYILYVESYKNSFQSNDPHKVREGDSHGLCWGFPLSWWCMHKRKNFHVRQPAETEWNAARDYPTSREKTKIAIVCSKRNVPGGRKEGNNIHL